MEEGPEPHEWVERSVEHHHHEQEHEPAPPDSRRAMMISAITAAVLAVFAALGSLLSGHAANHAILNQSKATDEWAYFQAKSTKGHIYEMGRDIVGTLGEAQGTSLEKLKATLDRFDQLVLKYTEEKAPIEHKAKELEEKSEHEFKKHGYFSQGVAAFQVGIVLASISIMVRYRLVWYFSLVGGAGGMVLLLIGLVI
jgi:hypothetical protein